MLKQELCLQCYEGTLAENNFDAKQKEFMLRGFNLVWSMNSHCMCKVSEEDSGLTRTMSIHSKPPIKCPYLLEHTVSEHA